MNKICYHVNLGHAQISSHLLSQAFARVAAMSAEHLLTAIKGTALQKSLLKTHFSSTGEGTQACQDVVLGTLDEVVTAHEAVF